MMLTHNLVEIMEILIRLTRKSKYFIQLCYWKQKQKRPEQEFSLTKDKNVTLTLARQLTQI